MSVINFNIMYFMIDGVVFCEEFENIMVVFVVFLNGEEFGNGCMII